MTEKFHKELKDLKAEVHRMGGHARGMLKDSVVALKEQDVKLAEDVISRKVKLADFDNEIERRALHILTLYSPVAVDLRTVACILILTESNTSLFSSNDSASHTSSLSSCLPGIGAVDVR